MLNVLVTGSNGQLGSELKELSKNYNFNFFFKSKNELDITKLELKNFIEENKINAVINCAAYTAVDKAESEFVKANLINSIAVGHLAQICKDLEVKLIHISTDYVYDGKNYKPYNESDKTDPICVYGKTKLAGEIEIKRINPKNSIIIRTSWLYSSFGSNFVKTILKLASAKDELNIINDQVGTPTNAADLAYVILEILPKIKNDEVEIYNYSNEGVASWFDFAKNIVEISNLTCKINPIKSTEYKCDAKRPYYSLLDKTKIKKDFNIKIPYYKDSLKKCLKILKEKSE